MGLLNSCYNSIFANNLAYNYFYGIYIGPASPRNIISRNTMGKRTHNDQLITPDPVSVAFLGLVT